MGIFAGFSKIFKEPERVGATVKALSSIQASTLYSPLTKEAVALSVAGEHHRKVRAKFTGSEGLFLIKGTAESAFAMADYFESAPDAAKREIMWEQTLGKREKARDDVSLFDKLKEKIADNPIAAMVVTAGLTYGVTKLGQGLIAKSKAAGLSEAKKGFLAKAGAAAQGVSGKIAGFLGTGETAMGDETAEGMIEGPSVVRIAAYVGAAVAIVVMGTVAFRML